MTLLAPAPPHDGSARWSSCWVRSQNVHRDLVAYTDVLAREAGQSISDPAKLVAPMLARIMATDRALAKARRKSQPRQGKR